MKETPSSNGNYSPKVFADQGFSPQLPRDAGKQNQATSENSIPFVQPYETSTYDGSPGWGQQPLEDDEPSGESNYERYQREQQELNRIRNARPQTDMQKMLVNGSQESSILGVASAHAVHNSVHSPDLKYKLQVAIILCPVILICGVLLFLEVSKFSIPLT